MSESDLNWLKKEIDYKLISYILYEPDSTQDNIPIFVYSSSQ